MKSSKSSRVSADKAFRTLGLSRSASLDEINRSFKTRLDDLQARHADKPETLVQEADQLYQCYRAAYLSKEGASEDDILPLTITGPDSLLNMFGIEDLPQRSIKVQMQSQAQYKDGQLVRRESNKTESFINKDGKREVKIYENGRLIKHTIDGRDMLRP